MTTEPLMPLRFKAVDPATGRASEPFTFSLQQEGQSSRWSWFNLASDPGNELLTVPAECCEPVICQSIGLTDCDGKEVFAGDVLVNIEPRMGVHPGVIVTALWRTERSAFWLVGKGESVCTEEDQPRADSYEAHKVDGFEVIGNCWEPAEVLLERARAAWEKHRAIPDFTGRQQKVPGGYLYTLFRDGEPMLQRNDKCKLTHAVMVREGDGWQAKAWCKDGWTADKKAAAFQKKGWLAEAVELES